ncbi:hypothetical protein FACS189425_07600 [Clostridia bacterium]|nr:hypothetical protein FACS189425_07600 [Clostridia bacterium]
MGDYNCGCGCHNKNNEWIWIIIAIIVICCLSGDGGFGGLFGGGGYDDCGCDGRARC